MHIVLTFLITIALLYIPYVNLFFRAINTMFHESGHAIMTLLTSGKVQSISLFANTEGVTKSLSSSWISSLLTSFSGYIFSSIMIILFAFLWKKGKNKIILWTLMIFSVVNLVLWVRNIYGILWLVAFIAILYVALKSKNQKVNSSITLGILIIMFTDAIRASIDIFMLSYSTPNTAGDASNLHNLTLIPTIVWGSLFLIQALIFSFIAIRLILKKKS